MGLIDKFVSRVTKKGVEVVKEEAKKTVEEAVDNHEPLLAIGAAVFAGMAVYKSMIKKSAPVEIPDTWYVIL